MRDLKHGYSKRQAGKGEDAEESIFGGIGSYLNVKNRQH